MKDKASLLQKIDTLEGLSQEEKAQLKSLLNSQKKYGLVWEDKPEEVERQLLENLPVLTEVKEKYIQAQESASSKEQPYDSDKKENGLKEAQLGLEFDYPTTDKMQYSDASDKQPDDSDKALNPNPSKNPTNPNTDKMQYSDASDKQPDDSDKALNPSLSNNPTNPNKDKMQYSDASDDIKTDGSDILSHPNPSENPTNPNKDNVAAPHHLLIEGDNLHALTALSFTHKEKIDVIYIDPPYNTGNKDFKYNDTFVDKEDSYRHSKWLSFMHKRLVLAKALLKDTGVIFISIDDNEQAQLKLLCDSVFGEEKYLSSVIWKSRQIVDSRNQNNLSNDHEYIIGFTKTELGKLKGRPIVRDKYLNPDNDPRGPWMSNSILGLANAEARPNLHYSIVDPKTSVSYPCPANTGWRYSQETMSSKIQDGRILFPKKPDGRPREKKFLSEVSSEFTGFSSILGEEVGYTLNGTREVREIVDLSNFSFPKPVSLVKTFVNQGSDSKSIVLDFFAGSGTTLHATMQLNAEDGGSRQCILVTNNENKIAEEVCYERNKRVIEGYTKPNGDKVAGLKNNHLHYYRAEFVPKSPHVSSVTGLPVSLLEIRKQITRQSIGLLCIKENCFEAVASGYDFVHHYQNESVHLILITDDLQLEQAIDYIKTLAPRPQSDVQDYIRVYVFSPGTYAYEADFEDLLDKVKLCALPEAILNAYRHVCLELDIYNKDFSGVSNKGQYSDASDDSDASDEIKADGLDIFRHPSPSKNPTNPNTDNIPTNPNTDN